MQSYFNPGVISMRQALLLFLSIPELALGGQEAARGVATVSKDNQVKNDDVETGGSSEGMGKAGTLRS